MCLYNVVRNPVPFTCYNKLHKVTSDPLWPNRPDGQGSDNVYM